MTTIASFLNTHIRKLARRELKGMITDAKKRSAEHRRSIAVLKRQMKQMQREMAALRKHLPDASKAPPQQVLAKSRLRIDGLKAHRQRLGLSAADYGKLLGVSSLTVYNWEAGKSKPRRSQLPRIVAVRGIGKREALARLNAA